MSALDEFGEIARLFRPLTRGAAGAFDLLDDAAVLPRREGHDVVVTKDAIVAGVHFLEDETPQRIGRRLAAVNLSDLAAKGAEPFAAFLAIAWPEGWTDVMRAGFATGLGEGLGPSHVPLLGGDTVATSGPLTASLTMMGWVPEGRAVLRSGARPGDLLSVSGVIGDGWLGLQHALGRLGAPQADLRYREPRARGDLAAEVLRAATAAADVSDGLIADARHIAEASRVRVEIDLDAVPLSDEAAGWLAAQPDRAGALRQLCSGGDDYEILAASRAPLSGFTVIGRVTEGAGLDIRVGGATVDAGAGGYRHGSR